MFFDRAAFRAFSISDPRVGHAILSIDGRFVTATRPTSPSGLKGCFATLCGCSAGGGAFGRHHQSRFEGREVGAEPDCNVSGGSHARQTCQPCVLLPRQVGAADIEWGLVTGEECGGIAASAGA